MSIMTDDNEVDDPSRDSRRLADWVTYFIQPENGGLIKIGKAKNLKDRLAMLQTGSAAPLVCLGYLEGDRESEMHRRFARLRLFGEWFRPGQELVEFILKEANGVARPIEREGCAAFEVQWLVKRWQRHHPGEWIDGTDEGAWQGRLNELDGFVHEREYGPYTEEQRRSVLSRDGRSDPIFDPHEDECECETCSFQRACLWVEELPTYGAIWNSDALSLTVFIRWRDFPPAQQEIMDLLAEAYAEIESAELPSLRAYRVFSSGEYETIDLWKNYRDWLRRSTSQRDDWEGD